METYERPVLAELSEAEQLYFRNRGIVCDNILNNSGLYVMDGEYIANSVAKRLDEYGGPCDDEAFIAWANEIARPDVERRIFFDQLRRNHRGAVRAGIWTILHANLNLRDNDSIPKIMREIESDTWVWVWQHIDDLVVPGTASLATRLRAAARFQAMTWRQTRLRANAKFDECAVKGLGDSDGAVSISATGEISTDRITIFDPGHDGDLEDGEVLDRPTAIRPPQPSDSLIAMKSGAPKLFCPLCKTVQAIVPDAVSQQNAVRLWCGHERPAILPMATK